MQRLYMKPLVNNLTVNVSIVGMNGSGKSAILVKYLTRRFIVEYAPYLSDSYTKADTIDGQEVTLNIQDTSDSDDMDLEEILKWSQAIIILFSITSRRSFYRAQELLESIKQNSEPHGRQLSQRPSSTGSTSALSSSVGSSNTASTVSSLGPGYTGSLRRTAVYGVATVRTPTLMLVANKSDLDRFRLVEKSEAEALAKAHGIPYYETTAAETYNEVQGIFHTVVRLSNSTRFSKSRGPNGVGASVGRSMSSSAGSLTPATGSVLSSLAVSPGLLLQKKGIPMPGLPPTIQQDTASPTVTDGDNNLTSPVARLTNLRFRGASPPTFGKNLRSPSPSITIGNRPQTVSAPVTTELTPATSQSGRTSLSHAQSFTGSTGHSEHPVKATTTSTPVRPPQPSQQTKQPAEDGSKLRATTPTPSSTNLQPPQAPPPLPPKRGPMGFRFFAKKSK
ncbi:Ras-like protein family member 12 [Clonorchis sinensis]|uniref:small monomeric GTPase n=1 Tax=Clonorchis sinensis TaxID=79923 RepID=H2KRE4_CLOSI|nr:Ras-like protein family member 12 [Clonorchis sinensis]